MDEPTSGVPRPISVIIADDHSVVRDGIRTVLEREDGEFRVVAEAADVPATISAAREARRAGARSYVLKEAEPAELLQAFRLAVAGGNYLHPRLGALLAAGEQRDSDDVALSDREREVVRLIANGYTNPQIAEQLHVAERTVKTYRARAIEKLGFSSRAEITAYVRPVGLAD